MFKKSLILSILAVVLALPATAFASSDPTLRTLEELYGPQDGQATVYEPSSPFTPPVLNASSFAPLAGHQIYLANYKVTTWFQIPTTITLASPDEKRIGIQSISETNTGTNTTYGIGLDYFSGWSATWVPAQSDVSATVGGSITFSFNGLDYGTSYRTRIVGNVKGTIEAIRYN